MKLSEGKGFGKQVSWIIMAGDPVKFKNMTESKVSDKLGSSEDMFCFLESYRIKGKVNYPFVVNS